MSQAPICIEQLEEPPFDLSLDLVAIGLHRCSMIPLEPFTLLSGFCYDKVGNGQLVVSLMLE